MNENNTPPLQGVGIILMDMGRTGLWLSLRRNRAKEWFGYLQTPGGRVEPGESHWEAAYRELKEETGLVVREARAITGCVEWVQPRSREHYRSTHYVGFTARVPNREDAGHGPWRFQPFSTVWEMDYPLLPAIEHALHRYARGHDAPRTLAPCPWAAPWWEDNALLTPEQTAL